MINSINEIINHCDKKKQVLKRERKEDKGKQIVLIQG